MNTFEAYAYTVYHNIYICLQTLLKHCKHMYCKIL